MSDSDNAIRDLIGRRLQAEGVELVDLVPIPVKGDRMVRIRSLEEALDDFDSTQSHETLNYLVQVRTKPGHSRETITTDEVDSFLSPHSVSNTSDEAFFAKLTDETLSGTHQENTFEYPQKDSSVQASESIYVADGKLNFPFLIKNAQVLFAAGDFAFARNIYRSILASGEKAGFAHYWIGRTYEAESKTSDASKHYEESIAFDPTLEAYQRFAQILIVEKKDQEAAEVFERALNLKNIAPSMYFEIRKAAGNCRMRSGALDLAQRHYQAALEIEPESDQIHSNLGAVFLQSGQISEAKNQFESAVGLNPKNDKALTGLGNCALQEGEKRLAHDWFARALSVNLRNPVAVFQLVKCAYELKSYATAARILGDYADIAPVNTNLLYSLAGLQYHLGRIEEAEMTALKIIDLQETHSGAKELLGLIHKLNGKGDSTHP